MSSPAAMLVRSGLRTGVAPREFTFSVVLPVLELVFFVILIGTRTNEARDPGTGASVMAIALAVPESAA